MNDVVVATKVRKTLDGGHLIFCPGCKVVHNMHHGIWTYNGDAVRPTFSPSLLFTSGHYISGQQGKPCWCTYEARTGRPLPRSIGCTRCHSFIRDGQMQFLTDSTHEMAGKTVPLPGWPYAPGTYGGVAEEQP